jgi:hypothetical protein
MFRFSHNSIHGLFHGAPVDCLGLFSTMQFQATGSEILKKNLLVHPENVNAIKLEKT